MSSTTADVTVVSQCPACKGEGVVELPLTPTPKLTPARAFALGAFAVLFLAGVSQTLAGVSGWRESIIASLLGVVITWSV